MLNEVKQGTKQEVKEEVKNTPVFDGDIDLSATRKKRFRINGDDNCWLELNVSDMGIISRLTEAYPKLEKLQEKAIKITASTSSDELDEVQLGKDIKAIDKDMRKILDSIFDAPVSEVCAPDGSMFDPFGGICRYEHIIGKLVELYDANIASEASDIKAHTDKYAKVKRK